MEYLIFLFSNVNNMSERRDGLNAGLRLRPRGGGGGTRKNFDRGARVILLSLTFDKKLFLGCSK